MRQLILSILLLLSVACFAEQRDGYSVSLVQISGYNAYLLVPDTAEEQACPAILLLHDHGAHFSIGKEKLVEPIWRTDQDSLTNLTIRDDARAWTKKFYNSMFVGDSLAKAGFVVLVADALYWGEQAPARHDGESLKAYNKRLKEEQPAFYSDYLAQHDEPWFETILREDKAAISYLLSLPYVCKSKVYSFGFSMGAYRSWQLAAADKRIAACAASNWMTTIKRTGGFITGVSSWSMYRPSSKTDYPRIASRISPRPLFIQYGETDKVCPLADTEDAIQTIRRRYRKGRLTSQRYPYGHVFTHDQYVALLEWLRGL